MTFNQPKFDIRCEWGEQGIKALSLDSDAIIIVDVLSFSTCVAVAVRNNSIVYPFHSTTMSAKDFATEKRALLATKQRNPKGYSLSPASLMNLPANSKIVLPSPNGSLLSIKTGTTPTFAGCLRNAQAVAKATQRLGARVSVIPAGERWMTTDFTLRPALEDWIGAGAIIHYLQGRKSVEAQAAEFLFLRYKDHLEKCFQMIGSGLELIEQGFSKDVQLASELNVTEKAPRLIDGAYRA